MAQKTARTQQLDKPARWTQELDDEFVAYYVEIAGRAHDVVSGGKCLKNAGWQAILAKLDGRGNIVDINQLKNMWKRLKEEYVDYAWLVKKFSGDGLQGIDDAKWAEEFIKFESTSIHAFDLRHSVTTVYWMSAADMRLCNEYANSSVLQSNVSASDESLDHNQEGTVPETMTAAKRRAKLVNERMKANRKRKEVADRKNLELKSKMVKSIDGIRKTMDLFVKIMAHKANYVIDEEDDDNHSSEDDI
ncbi:hypothetical protein LEN26_017164 [Aphanomyces euteiches]|nr:hypothetical protein LEN26_017164 [Aphanomyces euteiches]